MLLYTTLWKTTKTWSFVVVFFCFDKKNKVLFNGGLHLSEFEICADKMQTRDEKNNAFLTKNLH